MLRFALIRAEHGFLLHALHVLWMHRIALFWPVWTAITALAISLTFLALRRKTITQNRPRTSLHAGHHKLPRDSVVSVLFLALFLAFYIAGTLAWEGFTSPDDSMFTLGPLVGQHIAPPIWPSTGRFFPFGYQEYNLLRYVSNSVIGYHSLHILQLMILPCILLFLAKELIIRERVALILLMLVTPSFLISFSGLIYPEANLIFWLVFLAWSVNRFEQTHSMAWVLLAVISAQCMLYYKECAFLLLLGFTVGRLLLRCWNATQPGWDFTKLRDPESRLDICLALLVVPFLLYYLAAMYPHYDMRYAAAAKLPLAEVISTYAKIDLLAWIFVAVILARIFLILRHHLVPSLFWDGLALGALAYVSGYLILSMQSAYYLAPVDLIAVLYLGRLAFLHWQDMRLEVRLCAVTALTFIVLQDLSLSAFRMYERKNVIQADVAIGNVIEDRFRRAPQNAQRIFFPFARPYRITEFAAYLNYIGVPVEETRNGSDLTGGISLVAKKILKDTPCVEDRPFLCHAGSTPEPGDLVVILPDDFTRAGELVAYRQEGTEPIFSYRPYPSIPKSMQPFVRHLQVVSYAFFNRPLPDFWPNGAVIQWK
jgi:hypothetical protein